MVDNEPLSSKSSRLLSFFKIWILYINMYTYGEKEGNIEGSRQHLRSFERLSGISIGRQLVKREIRREVTRFN